MKNVIQKINLRTVPVRFMEIDTVPVPGTGNMMEIVRSFYRYGTVRYYCRTRLYLKWKNRKII